MHFTSSSLGLVLAMSAMAVAAPNGVSVGVSITTDVLPASLPIVVPPVKSLPNLAVSQGTSPLALPGQITATVGDIHPVESAFDIMVGLEANVGAKVTSVVSLISPCTGDSTAQHGLVPDILSELGDIVDDLTTAVSGIVAITLPTVLEIVGDLLPIVGDILFAVLAIVDGVASTLVNIIFGLVPAVLDLVTAELLAVLNLVGPLIDPILIFASDVIGAEVTSDITAILDLLDSALHLLGAPSHQCGCQ